VKPRAFLIPTIALATFSSPAWSVPAQAAPTAAPTLTEVKSVRVDVDGDGTSDRVQLLSAGGDQFQLKVTTKKASATAAFTSVLSATDNPASVWTGAAKLDGVKGNELLVQTTKPDTIGDFAVFTWRKGALVAEAAPAARSRAGWWSSDLHGFRFFTSHHRAFVDAANLASASKNGAHGATIVRSVWRNGRWVKVSTRSVKLSASRIGQYTGIQAPSLLISQAKVDLDGDGKLDSVAYRLLAPNKEQLKIVTAKGKRITRTIAASREYSGAPVIATIDGVPGAELAYVDSDGYSWKVLTVRKGKLVVSRSPEGNPTWTRSPEQFNEGYDLAVANGKWQVITNAKSTEGNPLTVTWGRYLWISGRWAKQETWTTTTTESEYDSLCRSFCGVEVTSL
jgi:hypothetical protein